MFRKITLDIHITMRILNQVLLQRNQLIEVILKSVMWNAFLHMNCIDNGVNKI